MPTIMQLPNVESYAASAARDLALIVQRINVVLAKTQCPTPEQVEDLHQLQSRVMALQSDLARFVERTRVTPAGGRKHRAMFREWESIQKRGLKIFDELNSLTLSGDEK